MKNKALADDYLFRAEHRIAAVELLLQRGSHADVVRESQEIVELCLKAVLMRARVEVPRLHDVSEVLKKEKDRLPASLKPHLDRLCKTSKSLRRDRELAFYGAEDLTPSEFYSVDDAKQALDDARMVFGLCKV